MIDLNADLGEGADDAAIMPLVTSANIACGAHAGDLPTMRRCVALGVEHGVALGAHPGYADRANFGRVAVEMSPADIERLVAEQVRLLAGVATEAGTRLTHVKPHGALYTRAGADRTVALAVAHGIRDADPDLRFVGLSRSMMIVAAEEAGLEVAREAFADRAYMADGSLAPRGMEGAVIDDPDDAADQAVAIALGEPIETLDGDDIVVPCDTLCLHGDSTGALERALAVREALEAEGIELGPLR